MAIVRPFKAIRPTRDKANLVATRSYLSYSDETLKEKLEHNPFTFLHIINPDYKDKIKQKGINKFNAVKAKFNDFKEAGLFITEDAETFYIYQQKNENHTFEGIIGATAVADYLNGNIKKHEHTLTLREEMFKSYLDTTGFNAEPVLLSYPKVPRINELMSAYMAQRPEYEFTSTNKVLHNLWLIDSQADIEEIQQLFENVDNLYIADGHHRSASSALLCQNSREATENWTGAESFNFFMSYLVDDEQMCIYDFNRMVSNLNNLSVDSFIAQVSKVYDLSKMNSPLKPVRKDEIAMYIEGVWYSLLAKAGTFNASHCVEHLDPAILSKNILEPILGIQDIRNDKRIGFMDGKKGLPGLAASVDSGEYAVAFALKPITFKQLKAVADQGEIMPPKSTYIEPKLRSGLTIYTIDDDEN